MIISKQFQEDKLTLIEAELEDINIYPSWQATNLAHIKIYDKLKKRWTDCWISAIEKNRRIKFFMSHDRGYPSEHKGTSKREILAHWLSDDLPAYKDA